MINSIQMCRVCGQNRLNKNRIKFKSINIFGCVEREGGGEEKIKERGREGEGKSASSSLANFVIGSTSPSELSFIT